MHPAERTAGDLEVRVCCKSPKFNLKRSSTRGVNRKFAELSEQCLMSTMDAPPSRRPDNCALRREDEVLQPLLEVANRYVPWTSAKPLWIVNRMTQHCLCLVSVRVMSYYHAGRSLSPMTRRKSSDRCCCELQVCSILFARPKAMRLMLPRPWAL